MSPDPDRAVTPPDLEPPTSTPVDPDDAAFVTRARAALAEAAADRDDLLLAASFRALRPRPKPWVPMLTAALIGAVTAALVVGVLLRPDPDGPVAAFDGGAPLTDPGGPEVVVTRDARGRIAEIARPSGAAFDGERLLFRAGRLIRTEQWRGGVLDGVVVDFDAAGRVVRIQTFVEGVASGPTLELDAALRVRGGTP